MEEDFVRSFSDSASKLLSSLEHDLVSKFRSGAVQPSLVDTVQIDVYGSRMPLNQVASVSVQGALCLVVQPWDAGNSQLIRKTLEKANVASQIVEDGDNIRILFPPMSEDERQSIVKGLQQFVEERKVIVRNFRREANDKVKEAKKNSVLTEDEARRYELDIQKRTDSVMSTIEEMSNKRRQAILSV